MVVLRAVDLVVLARRRAGLSQAQLAQRLGRAQSTIARWELGEMEPPFAAVIQLLAACDVEPTMDLANPDSSYLGHVDDQLRMPPSGRLARMGRQEHVSAVMAIACAAPQAVLIGDVAAALVGGPLMLPRGHVVVQLCARPADRSAIESAAAGAGAVAELIDVPPGTRGYRDLRRAAVSLDVDGVAVLVAAPLDLVRILRTAHDGLQALAVEAVLEHGHRWPAGPQAKRQYTETEARAALDAWMAKK